MGKNSRKKTELADCFTGVVLEFKDAVYNMETRKVVLCERWQMHIDVTRGTYNNQCVLYVRPVDSRYKDYKAYLVTNLEKPHPAIKNVTNEFVVHDIKGRNREVIEVLLRRRLIKFTGRFVDGEPVMKLCLLWWGNQ